MPDPFRVIGGPHDGEEWPIAMGREGEILYCSQEFDQTIEHLYRLSLVDMTARHDGWIRAERRQHG